MIFPKSSIENADGEVCISSGRTTVVAAEVYHLIFQLFTEGGRHSHIFHFPIGLLEIHEMGVPLNHPFVDGIFHEINPAFLGYSPVLETPNPWRHTIFTADPVQDGRG